jgi:hypothetical protein
MDPEFFSGRGRGEGGREEKADPEKVRVPDLCLTLKIMLQKSSCMSNSNTEPLVNASNAYECTYIFCDSLTQFKSQGLIFGVLISFET